MHHRDDLVLGEDARQCRPVGDVADDERAADEFAMAGGEIVVDDGAESGALQCAAAMRADIARAAGNQDRRTGCHQFFPLRSPACGLLLKSK